MRTVATLLIAFIFSSCLSVETDIHLNPDGSTDTNLIYILGSTYTEFGKTWERDEPWPLPLEKESFLQRALWEPGTQLASYRISKLKNQSQKIEIKLKSESLESLARYLNIKLAKTITNQTTSITLQFPHINNSPRHRNLWKQSELEKIFETSEFTFRIHSNTKPKSVSAGRIKQRTAIFTTTIQDIMHGNSLDKWIVRW